MIQPLKLPNGELYGKQTFFSLMLAGYANDVEPERIERFHGDASGTKRNTWSDNHGWLGIDEWRTTPHGNGSNGTTSLYYNSVLVWEMQYGGWYLDDAILCLRAALKQNYQRSVWHGGRGPEGFMMGELFYTNHLTKGAGGDFDHFSGRERIVTDSGVTLGVHEYRGGFLIDC